MFTTIAFSEVPAAATEQLILGVPDQSHRVSGDDIYVGKYNKLVGAYAFGYALSNCRLSAPSLRRVSSLYVAPLVNDLGGYAEYTSKHLDWRGKSALPLTTNEALNAYGTAAASADQNFLIGVWLADAPIVPVEGEIWTVYAYHAISAVQKVWTNTELTWADDLPVGRYQVVGARAWTTYGGIFRFVFIGEANRPGGVCCHEKFLQEDIVQRKGGMGVWGEFDSVNPPSVDWITPWIAGDDSGIYMRIDLIKIG